MYLLFELKTPTLTISPYLLGNHLVQNQGTVAEMAR
ncbi:MAG: hypothetical protein GFH27_549323n150 [Chloroflexi bacterium AL-W]|nr:hypothetical protein [Chloroflexi bacterium AL-N1]NOK70301.1 hypothetical protein [Chloroflexi bacterium AL-N10]NOK77838.1 hypothetical protein [Chloroflexi bacterium AL-N5]NOK84847.1 hypothetical protein [Chloroflexi bacterium AL-W]NOK92454.1 hypothetical protein [Chloroflexi bacterium AL-N15]